MQNLPSDTQETGQKVHQIRLAKTYFDDVANGIKTFELQKNDRGYKKGDHPRNDGICGRKEHGSHGQGTCHIYA